MAGYNETKLILRHLFSQNFHILCTFLRDPFSHEAFLKYLQRCQKPINTLVPNTNLKASQQVDPPVKVVSHDLARGINMLDCSLS